MSDISSELNDTCYFGVLHLKTNDIFGFRNKLMSLLVHYASKLNSRPIEKSSQFYFQNSQCVEYLDDVQQTRHPVPY